MPEPKPPAGRPVRAQVLGVPVTACSFDAALSWFDAAVEERRGTYLSTANVYALMLARRDPAHRARLAGAGLVAADGVPLVWALRRLGHRGAERVHGDDLLLAYCARRPQHRHFLLGGAPGQAEAVADELRRRVPGLTVAGTQATPVRPLPPEETERVVAQIAACGADVVWVALGTPAQDEWMAAQAARVGRPMAGVGSSFDLLSGRTRPTPRWMQRGGLQWLYRWAQEPRRLWRRYLVNNPVFLALLLLQLAGVLRYGDEEAWR